MDWDWDKFSGENEQLLQVSTFSDSIGSNQKSGDGNLKGISQENKLSSSSSFHGSSKRTRLINGTQNQTCLVDGCESDLSNCKEYHRRHRVCDSHSKTPVVIVRGEEKRFCQQCSRFHSLGEFDEVKRSCRKRLDGHNRRRRKPQPESLFMSSRDFLSNCKGPIVLQFGNPQIHVTDMGRSLWPVTARTEEKSMIPPNSNACFNYGGDKQLPVLQINSSGKQTASHISFCQPLPDAISAASDLGSSRMVPAAMSPTVDSGCALYLLSSQSHPGQVLPYAGLSSLVQSHRILPVQTQDFDLQFSSLSESSGSGSGSFGMKDKPISKTNIDGDLMLEMEESVGLLESEVSHKFPVSWE